jgi:nicotinate-nucleotide adenylyltransferase
LGLSQGSAKRLGVYGGAFDPPHLAHLALAKAAIAQYALDELIIVPTGQAWHKSRALSAASHRVAMTKLAFADLPRANVDERETLRTGPSFTFDTLQELKSENDQAKLFLLMGEDQLADFAQWHRYQEILQIATLLVAHRTGTTPASGLKELPNQAKIQFAIIQMPASPISATRIRQMANQRRTQFESFDHLVKQSVARYIAEHHLY